MAIHGAELDWLDERETVTVTELSRVCALSVADLQELIDYGALETPREVRQQRVFSARCVMPLRQAARLRNDLDLDLYAVAVLLGCLERIDALEHELRSLQARLPDPRRQDV